jgi:hypothetical protein
MTSALDLSWSTLRTLAVWTPASSLSARLVRIEDDLFRLRTGAYLVCLPYDERFEAAAGERFVTALLWAASDGAARRAHLMEIEADDLATGPAPGELLPPGQPQAYGAIMAALKTSGCRNYIERASYRIAKDGAFVHRAIDAPPYSFFFRNPEDDDSDRCYAVQYRLLAQNGT